MTIEKIIKENSGLVYHIANKLYLMNRRRDKTFDLEDLAQAGFYALCKHGHMYDESRGKISTFVYHCVKNEILKLLKSNSSDRAGDANIENVKEPSYYQDFEVMAENLDEYFKIKKDEERDILALKLQSFKHQEISEKQNIKKSRVERILRQIKERHRNA